MPSILFAELNDRLDIARCAQRHSVTQALGIKASREDTDGIYGPGLIIKQIQVEDGGSFQNGLDHFFIGHGCDVPGILVSPLYRMTFESTLFEFTGGVGQNRDN